MDSLITFIYGEAVALDVAALIRFFSFIAVVECITSCISVIAGFSRRG